MECISCMGFSKIFHFYLKWTTVAWATIANQTIRGLIETINRTDRKKKRTCKLIKRQWSMQFYALQRHNSSISSWIWLVFMAHLKICGRNGRLKRAAKNENEPKNDRGDTFGRIVWRCVLVWSHVGRSTFPTATPFEETEHFPCWLLGTQHMSHLRSFHSVLFFPPPNLCSTGTQTRKKMLITSK